MIKAPWYTRLALGLAIALPVYFLIAALGTKFGLWDWKFGLGTMIMTAGPIVIGAVALIALIALITVLIRAPRKGWGPALIALLVPVGIIGYLGTVRAENEPIPPIYDIATDRANPPVFSAETMAARDAAEANPLMDLNAPINSMEQWQGDRFAEIGGQSADALIAEAYPDMQPLMLDIPTAQAIERVTDAMRAMDFADISADAETGTVSAVAETFWFGFRDDVVARVEPGPNDAGSVVNFRSTSRVGLSDLGANAKRITALREVVSGN